MMILRSGLPRPPTESDTKMDDKELEADPRLNVEGLRDEAGDVEVEEVDLEEYAKRGEKPPKAKRYKLKVNDEKFVWPRSVITGREVLELAGLTPPENYLLRLKVAGSKPRPIDLDKKVDLSEPGVEKFRAIRKGQEEGEISGRRNAPALDQDRLFLDNYGLPWEMIVDGCTWVLLHDFPLPAGFNVDTATVAIRLEGGYPLTPLDMMYVYPWVSRLDGRPIRQADVTQQLDGKGFQRWSRHRTGANPWMPGEDSLETHVYLVEEFFREEIAKQ